MAGSNPTPFVSQGKPIKVTAAEKRDLELLGVPFPDADAKGDEGNDQKGDA